MLLVILHIEPCIQVVQDLPNDASDNNGDLIRDVITKHAGRIMVMTIKTIVTTFSTS